MEHHGERGSRQRALALGQKHRAHGDTVAPSIALNSFGSVVANSILLPTFSRNASGMLRDAIDSVAPLIGTIKANAGDNRPVPDALAPQDTSYMPCVGCRMEALSFDDHFNSLSPEHQIRLNRRKRRVKHKN
jgi:hypothetical protein